MSQPEVRELKTPSGFTAVIAGLAEAKPTKTVSRVRLNISTKNTVKEKDRVGTESLPL